MSWHSKRCRSDPKTHWNGTQCVSCGVTVRPGRGLTPNCGRDDEGGIHEAATRPCGPNSFNDGTRDFCASCSPCPSGLVVSRRCNATADTQCAFPGSGGSPAIHVTEPQRFTVPTPALPVINSHMPVLWAVSSLLLVFILLAALAVYTRRKRGTERLKPKISLLRAGSYKRPSYVNAAFTNSDVEGMLDHTVLSAPLQTVLDNLDVLEELVILLDPESRGIKNTKHLASLCSFPSTWITYTYSMKESKSPLRAVLEGVTSRNPDWTVGHLVEMLKRMERNDAIAALAKLRPDVVNL